MLLASVLLVVVFGWTGGKLLVSGAYVDAKQRAAEMKAARRRTRAERAGVASARR